MSEEDWLNIFSGNLSSMLYDAGMTQRDLADETGLSEATISCYLNQRKIPGVKALINIAHVFDCSLDELIDFGENII